MCQRARSGHAIGVPLMGGLRYARVFPFQGQGGTPRRLDGLDGGLVARGWCWRPGGPLRLCQDLLRPLLVLPMRLFRCDCLPLRPRQGGLPRLALCQCVSVRIVQSIVLVIECTVRVM